MEIYKEVSIDKTEYMIMRLNALEQIDAIEVLAPIIGLIVEASKEAESFKELKDSTFKMNVNEMDKESIETCFNLFMKIMSKLKKGTLRELFLLHLASVKVRPARGAAALDLIEDGEITTTKRDDLPHLFRLCVEVFKYNFLPLIPQVETFMEIGKKTP